MRFIAQVGSLSLLVCLSFNSMSQPQWEIDKNKDGIAVYTRTKQGSQFKSFKAEALLNAPIAEIIEILKNANDYTRWYGFTKTAHILKQEMQVQYNYVETIFPWPFSNRDMVYKMSIDSLGEDTIKISLKGLPDFIEEKKGIVRMIKAEGYLLLQRKADHTAITYVFHSEPGDHIPPGLANHSIAELPFRTLKGLKGMIEERGKINR